MSFQDLLGMFGGLAVFMFGMHTLSGALEKLNEGESYFPFRFEHHGALPGEAEI